MRKEQHVSVEEATLLSEGSLAADWLRPGEDTASAALQPAAAAYVRFAVERRNRSSQEPEGIFHAARRLWESGYLAPNEVKTYLEVRAWFNSRLEKPERFSRSTNPQAHPHAVSWFKSNAAEHIAQAKRLAELLENHGIRVQRITTDRPGYVVFEDEHQVTAEPFRGERRGGR